MARLAWRVDGCDVAARRLRSRTPDGSIGGAWKCSGLSLGRVPDGLTQHLRRHRGSDILAIMVIARTQIRRSRSGARLHPDRELDPDPCAFDHAVS